MVATHIDAWCSPDVHRRGLQQHRYLGRMAVKLMPRARFLAPLRAVCGALGVGGRRGEAEAAAPTEPEPDEDDRQPLIDRLAREIAKSERFGAPVSLAVVEVAELGEIARRFGPAAADAAISQLRSALQRVTRTRDFVSGLDGGRFAVVLVGCTAENTTAFRRRLSLAAGNRPIGAAGAVVAMTTNALEYSRAKYRGPESFLGAATGDGDVGVRMPSPSAYAELRQARRADPHELRRQLGLKPTAGTKEPAKPLARGFRA